MHVQSKGLLSKGRVTKLACTAILFSDAPKYDFVVYPHLQAKVQVHLYGFRCGWRPLNKGIE